MKGKDAARRYLPVAAVFCVVVFMLTGLWLHNSSMKSFELDPGTAVMHNLIDEGNGEFTIADGAYVTEDGGPAWLLFRGLNRYVGTVSLDFGEITTHEIINILTLTIYYDTGEGFREEQKVETSVNPGGHRLALHPLAHVKNLKIQIGTQDKENFVIRHIVLNPQSTGWQPFFWISAASGIAAVLFFGIRKKGYGRNAALLASGILAVFFGYAHLMFRRTDCSCYLLAAQALLLLLTGLVYASELDEAKRKKLILWTMLACAFALFTFWAMMLDYSKAPDEHMRMRIVDYIKDHGRIPRGDDPEIRDPYWGFGYSFYPVTTQILAALICRLVSFVSEEGYVMMKAARMASVLCGTGTVYWAYRIGQEVMPDTDAGYLLPVLTFTLPQLAFLNSYLNNDSLAVMSIMMILYFWIRGLKDGFATRTALGLSVGIGLCALSYYNAYGAILLSIPVFYYGLFRYGRDRRYAARATALVAGGAILLAGWWFIRSAILYHGDFLGRSALQKTQEMYASKDALKKANASLKNQGTSIAGMLLIEKLHYIRDVGMSFVGRFGYMENVLRPAQYAVIQLVIAIGSAASVCNGGRMVFLHLRKKDREEDRIRYRDKAFLAVMLFGLMLIPFCLALYYSWSADFQKQGRYYMPVCVPLFFITACGADSLMRKKHGRKGGAGYLVSLLLMLNVVMVFLSVAYQFYY